MKLLKNLYFAICFVFLMALPVYAYIDPSVATAAVQIIAGIAVVVGTVVGVAWRRAKKKVQEKLGIDEDAGKEKEAEVEFEEDDD